MGYSHDCTPRSCRCGCLRRPTSDKVTRCITFLRNGRGCLSVEPLSEWHKGAGKTRGGWGRRKTGELAAGGHGRGAIRHPEERSRRWVGVHTCTPAAAGELAEQRSNDPRVVVADHRPRVTICAIKTRVSQGKGCECGAACLRRPSQVFSLNTQNLY